MLALTLHLELRSNMYRDVVRTSRPATVFVPLARAREGAAPVAGPASGPGSAAVMRVDVRQLIAPERLVLRQRAAPAAASGGAGCAASTGEEFSAAAPEWAAPDAAGSSGGGGGCGCAAAAGGDGACSAAEAAGAGAISDEIGSTAIPVVAIS
eukprot:TRINITY_DN4889_c0_g2_i1.p2 TRINITY_DN4889_c0_g2~~TRINITY_DN4889_c0_g2_i1.p2  ORF type:complete len:162 (+),score=76.02 TRINITY_DN4889_c0_g2_i1:29-487(+)